MGCPGGLPASWVGNYSNASWTGTGFTTTGLYGFCSGNPEFSDWCPLMARQRSFVTSDAAMAPMTSVYPAAYGRGVDQMEGGAAGDPALACGSANGNEKVARSVKQKGNDGTILWSDDLYLCQCAPAPPADGSAPPTIKRASPNPSCSFSYFGSTSPTYNVNLSVGDWESSVNLATFVSPAQWSVSWTRNGAPFCSNSSSCSTTVNGATPVIYNATITHLPTGTVSTQSFSCKSERNI